MANPSTLVDNLMAVLTATTTEASVTLNRKQKYSIAHSGQDSSGLVSTDTVYLSISKAVDTDASEGDDKMIVPDKSSIEIGPGATNLNFATAAGEATLLVTCQHSIDSRI